MIKKSILGLALSFLASAAMVLTFDINRIWTILIFLVLAFLSIKGMRDNKRVRIVALIFSILYSLVYVIGDAVYNTGVIDTLYNSGENVLITLISISGLSYLLYIINYYLFNFLDNYQMKEHPSKILDKSYIFLFVWLLIFLLWIPCYLAYFPGIYSYDITKQVKEIFSGYVTKFHPPIHTGVVALCFLIADILKVEMIEVYGIMQMLLLSYAISKLIKFLYMKTKNSRVVALTFLFLVINPVMAIISLLPTKDVYFGAILVLLIPDIYNLVYDTEEFLKSKFNIVKLIFFMVLAMLFRNNALYVFLLFLIVLFIVMFKNKKVRFIAITTIVLYILINNIAMPNLYIHEGNSREKLAVPITQISYVVSKHEDEMSKEDLKWIDKYIPLDRIRTRFNPRFVDPVKAKFKTSRYDDNPGDFYKMYFHIGSKYFSDYISSFLNLNIPYWYTKASAIDPYSDRLYIETGIYESNNYIFEIQSKLPKLYDFYQEFASYEIQERHFILDKIYSIYLPIWIILISGFICILKKKYKSILVILPLLLLWLTYLLGPVSNFRYIIPIYFLYPLIIWLMLDKKDNS